MTDIQKLKTAIQTILSQESNEYLASADGYDAAYAIYEAEVKPAAVLELIAEVERLEARNVAQMRVNLSLRNRRKEWVARAGKAEDEAIDAEEQRDQLKAENAGLKTGYEAYEQVNAELRGEVERLRKFEPSKEILWCACGDGYPVNGYGAGFMDANNGVCANCDAANSAAKQSTSAQIAAVLGRHKQEIDDKAFTLKREGMIAAQKECDRIAGDSAGRTDRERKGAGECSAAIRALIEAVSKGEQS